MSEMKIKGYKVVGIKPNGDWECVEDPSVSENLLNQIANECCATALGAIAEMKESEYCKMGDVLNTFKSFYERMGVDMHGVWNKQLVEIIKESDTDDTRLQLSKLWEDLTTLPTIKI